MTNKLIVAHMSKSELSNSDVVLFIPAAFFVHSYCSLDGWVSEFQLLVVACIFVTADLLWYSASVSYKITI